MESPREPYPDADDPDFARGVDHEAPPDGAERSNQFSEGQEDLPRDTLEEGRFSEGQEDLPHPPPPEKNRFSEGQEELPRPD